MRQPRNGEVLLTNPSEKWLRSTHPNALVDRGEVGWEAFRLRPEDNGELSGMRDSRTTAREADEARLNRRFQHTGELPKSGGTWGVSVEQLTQMELQCFDDTKDSTKKDIPEGHAFIDLTEYSEDRAARKNIAIELAEAANINGCLWMPSLE